MEKPPPPPGGMNEWLVSSQFMVLAIQMLFKILKPANNSNDTNNTSSEPIESTEIQVSILEPEEQMSLATIDWTEPDIWTHTYHFLWSRILSPTLNLHPNLSQEARQRIASELKTRTNQEVGEFIDNMPAVILGLENRITLDSSVMLPQDAQRGHWEHAVIYGFLRALYSSGGDLELALKTYQNTLGTEKLSQSQLLLAYLLLHVFHPVPLRVIRNQEQVLNNATLSNFFRFLSQLAKNKKQTEFVASSVFVYLQLLFLHRPAPTNEMLAINRFFREIFLLFAEKDD